MYDRRLTCVFLLLRCDIVVERVTPVIEMWVRPHEPYGIFLVVLSYNKYHKPICKLSGSRKKHLKRNL